MRNTFHTSRETGIAYWINEDGIAQRDDQFDSIGCECELDWRCPLHHGQPTPIELLNHYDAQAQGDIDAQNGWVR